MATYISLLKWTEKGIGSVWDATGRRDFAKQAAASMGVTWKHAYLVMGQWDVVLLFEAADDETAARFLIAAGGQGFFSTHTLRAWTEDEADAILASLPDPQGLPQ